MLRVIFLLLFTTAAFAQSSPKNIILVIGDGMGPAHFTAARLTRGAEFQIGRMKTIGLATTSCADRAVTDSAAAATALSTGFKAKYEAVGIDANGEAKPTVLEVAEKAGKATGLVTTSYFYDATPCSFAAHAPHRDRHADIARQMLASGAEIIVGSVTDNDLPVRELAKNAGFTVVTTFADLDTSTAPHILGVFPGQPRDLDFAEAPLPELARSAIARLSKSSKGFFLLIEHEGTDSGSHQNHRIDVDTALKSFDAAVGVALDFAEQSKDTLVVVTGDHETGGLRISETKLGRWRMEWSTGDHTAVAVPVFAFGPGASQFAGFQDNTDVGKKLLELVK